MLEINIEFLPRDTLGNYEPDNNKIFKMWSGDYNVDRHRVVPFSKVIGQIRTRYAIKLLCEIYDPRKEVLNVRYSLAYRRLFSGKFSAHDILNTEAHRNADHIALIRQMSPILSKLAREECDRSELLRFHSDLPSLSAKVSGEHSFYWAAHNLIYLVSSDSPACGQSRIQGSRRVSFLEDLYDRSFHLYLAYQRKALNFQPSEDKIPGGFIKNMFYLRGEDRKKFHDLEFENNMQDHFNRVIEQDLIAVIGPTG